MIGLTPQQTALLRFIAGYQTAHGGVSPSVRECGRGIGVRGLSNVVRLLRCLEERGAIRRLPRCERAIEVLTPDAIPSACSAPLYAVPMVGERAMLFSGERV